MTPLARRSKLLIAALSLAALTPASATLYDWTYFAGQPGVTGTVNGTGEAAEFNYPTGAAVDASGNVYLSDGNNNTIRKITSAGVVTTFAGTPGISGTANGTGSAARFNFPSGVAVDGSGNVYVADANNRSIRRITPAGAVSTIPTGHAFAYPAAVAVDGSGNIYVADEDASVIAVVTQSGSFTTLAGTANVTGTANGTGAAAQFNSPSGVAVDGSGNVYVADSNNSTIREITPGGVVTTLAGAPGVTGTADGTGAAAQFNNPTGIALDTAGNLYVADSFNQTVRKIAPGGVVTTIGGTPRSFITQPGYGSGARFTYLGGIAVSGTGNLYLADETSNVIFLGAPLPPYTIPPMLAAPASDSEITSPIPVSFVLPEPVLAGSVNLVFNNNAGTVVTLNLSSSLTTGTYSFTVDPENPSSSPAVAGISGSSTIPLGTYTVSLGYQDIQGDPAATTSSTNVSITPLITGSPSTYNSHSATVTGTISSDYLSGAITNQSFEWGLTGTYGNTVSASQQSGTINTVLMPNLEFTSLNGYEAGLSGLNRDTAYHYQFVATINGTTYYGGDQTFTTTHDDPPTTQPYYCYKRMKVGVPVTLDVLANDSPGNPSNHLTITSVSESAGGHVQITGSETSLVYTPNARFAGHDSFSYNITDGEGGTATGIVYILNPYLGSAGNYQSILTGTTPGYLTLTQGRGGGFTGSIKALGTTYSFAGALTAADPTNTTAVTGTASVAITRAGEPNLTLDLTLDPTTGAYDYTLLESRTILASSAFTQKILYSGANPAPETGSYTVIIPARTGTGGGATPLGTGWATMTVVPSGAISITGKLADGTAFTAGSWLDDNYVSNPDVGSSQTFPVYANLKYQPAGYISGVMTFEDIANVSDFDGTLTWYEPPQAAASPFSNGFNLSLTMLGSSYVDPGTGYIIDLQHMPGNALVTLGNGGLTNTVTIPKLPATAAIVTGGTSDRLSLSFLPAGGVFQGGFLQSGMRTKTKFGGVVFQKQNLGAGTLITAGQNGKVSITPEQ